MALDVPTPDPPPLSNRGTPSEFEAAQEIGAEFDFRREELEEILEDGAWQEAFDEWAEYTDLSEAAFDEVAGLGLIDRLDFFWDPTEEQLRYDTPEVGAAAGEIPGDLDAETATTVDAELSELGRTVVETIVDAYLDWREAEPSDYVWDEETFGEGIDRGD